MDLGQPQQQSRRRNRIIAAVAGAITVTAIVLAFAAEYLELPWKWLRPAAELLLLAELVGLIVLERHQLFEPVSEKVTGIETRIAEIQATLSQINERMTASGQVIVTVGVREAIQLRARLLREALAREQEGPQLLRGAALSGAVLVQDTREMGEDWPILNKATSDFVLAPGSGANSKGYRWSGRLIIAWATIDAFKSGMEWIRSMFEEVGALNVEVKIIVRARPEAMLSPAHITDRDVFLAYDNQTGRYRWGLSLQGRQYVTLCARWFDDQWSSIPDSYLIYSRNGLNQKVVDQVKREIEANDAAPRDTGWWR
jgi:hypothetical protein